MAFCIFRYHSFCFHLTASTTDFLQNHSKVCMAINLLYTISKIILFHLKVFPDSSLPDLKTGVV